MKKFEKGFSLVEVILVLMTVGFLVLLIANLPASVLSINKSRHASLARDIASKEIENLRKQSFANLVNGTNNLTEADLNGLPSATGTVEVEDCPVNICTSSEQAKKVEVKVSWNESGNIKDVDLVTIISEGGIGQ